MKSLIPSTAYSILFSLLAMTNPGYGQDKPIHVDLDTGLIKLGDQTKINMTVIVNTADTIIWPQIEDTLTGTVEIINKTRIDTALDSTHITTRILSQQLTITSFDSGYHAIPPFRFILNKDTIESEALLLGVQIPIVDTTNNIFDIKPPIEVNYTWLDWLKDHDKWVIIPILVGILIFAGIYFWKRRKKISKVVKVIKPDKPAHIIALEKLNHLKDRKLWQQGKIKEYYTVLTEIVREYITNRYKFNALEQTTFEILQNLKYTSIDVELKNKLQELLFLADIVKFAKGKPLPTENDKSIDIAFEFVNNTRKIEVTKEEKQQDIKAGNIPE